MIQRNRCVFGRRPRSSFGHPERPTIAHTPNKYTRASAGGRGANDVDRVRCGSVSPTTTDTFGTGRLVPPACHDHRRNERQRTLRSFRIRGPRLAREQLFLLPTPPYYQRANAHACAGTQPPPPSIDISVRVLPRSTPLVVTGITTKHCFAPLSPVKP